MRELKLDEIAEFLNLAPYKVERWVRQGKIPIRHQDKDTYAFNEKNLINWAKKLNISINDSFNKNIKEEKKKNDIFFLTDAMKKGGFYYDIEGADIESFLGNLFNEVKIFDLEKKKKILEEILKREQISSTIIGNGIALPHPKNIIQELDENIVITAFFKNKSTFSEKEIFIAFVLLGISNEMYISLLSKLSFCLKNISFINLLKTIPKPEVMIEETTKILTNSL